VSHCCLAVSVNMMRSWSAMCLWFSNMGLNGQSGSPFECARVHACVCVRVRWNPECLHVPPSAALAMKYVFTPLALSYAGCTFANNSLSSLNNSRSGSTYGGGLYLAYSSSVASSPVSLDGE
jgi:hypothetical protein